jgi:phosphoglucomutase
MDTLTGFKFIGEKIKEFEENHSHTFLFGYEESYGYLAGTFVRDKDAVIASTLACEMGVYYKDKGISIYEALQNIYRKYGYYREALKSITMKGKEGGEQMNKIMHTLRGSSPVRIGTENVIQVKDYKDGIDGLPKSDVLQLFTDKKSVVSVRPSGTEPKIKIYYSAAGKSRKDSEEKLSSLVEGFSSIIERITKQG